MKRELIELRKEMRKKMKKKLSWKLRINDKVSKEDKCQEGALMKVRKTTKRMKVT